MLDSTQSREVVFFVIVCFMIFLSLTCLNVVFAKVMNAKTKYVVYITVSVFATAALLGIYKGTGVNSQRDDFHFDVTMAKKCEGYPYMTQNGKQHEECKKFMETEQGRREYMRYNCRGGQYNGRPLYLYTTPMSNKNWKNEMCDCQMGGGPEVL